jgi:hypothetical protein
MPLPELRSLEKKMRRRFQSQRAGVEVHVQVGRSRQLVRSIPYQTGEQMDAEHQKQRRHARAGH